MHRERVDIRSKRESEVKFAQRITQHIFDVDLDNE